jgi:hypothetical protein
MHAIAIPLADEFKRAFASADADITWLAAEEERSLWLTPNTLLIGKIDARGLTGDGHPFFADWKTLSNYRARYIEEEKQKWRTAPQALTYGVLLADWCNRFTVRWAIKPDARGNGIATAFEWYSYNEAELEHWRKQLIEMAQRIRIERLRNDHPGGPWLTNFGNCFRYGMKYACPFFGKCSSQDWGRSLGSPRKPHSQLEEKMASESKGDLVVLSSSRVGDYLECPESYRNKWEGEGFNETSEALDIGTDFHAMIATHIENMIVKET